MPSARAATKKPSRSSADVVRAAVSETAPDFDPEHRVGHLLRRAYHRAKSNTSAVLKDVGVTPMQAAAIMALRSRGEVSQAELGRAIAMEPANVHVLLARLTKLGLVDLSPHAVDARQIVVALSPKGEERAQRIADVTARASAQTLQPLTVAERDVLLELLARITK